MQVRRRPTANPETAQTDTMLRLLFARLFDRERELVRARKLGAVSRVRSLHPFDVVLALVASASRDEHRSVATARRRHHRLTGFVPQEHCFFERLRPGPGLEEVTWEVFVDVLPRANRVQRRQIARAFGLRVRDVRAVDGSRVTLPTRAAAEFPSTDEHLGGFKIAATLSILHDLLPTAHVTDARQHGRKAFSLPDDTRGVLWLADRGYSDHGLFAQTADGAGSFVTRLESSSEPKVTKIQSGLAKRHLRVPLARSLPVFGVVDAYADGDFNVARSQRTFRGVGNPVTKNKQGEPDWTWLATHLPGRVAAETIGAMCRLRWCVENLFRSPRSVGRLDELSSDKRVVVRLFIAATLVGLVPGQAICARMRAARPHWEPSLHRVFALLLANIEVLAHAVLARTLSIVLPTFIAALWREGINPNPGRPYALRRHLATVGA